MTLISNFYFYNQLSFLGEHSASVLCVDLTCLRNVHSTVFVHLPMSFMCVSSFMNVH